MKKAGLYFVLMVASCGGDREDVKVDALRDSTPARDLGSDVSSTPDMARTADGGTPADAAGDASRDSAPDAAVDRQPDRAPDVVANCGRIKCDCTFNGKQLFGKVQFVTSFPDFKVRESSFPDLKVQKVTAFPSSCGKWQEVTSFPDFKVQIVTAFEDFSIEYSSFPGLP